MVKTDTYWYTRDGIDYDSETSGFRYNLAVEDCSYEVTVGIKIPGWWSARKVDIDLEGVRTTSQASVPGGACLLYTSERLPKPPRTSPLWIKIKNFCALLP